MNYVKCNACPSVRDCNECGKCLNVLVTAADIHKLLAVYDKTVDQLKEQRAADPKWQSPVVAKPAIVKPMCWHSYSAFNICTACGDWKK